MTNKIACVSTMKCFEHLLRECNLKTSQQMFHRIGSQYDLDGVQFSDVLMLGDSFYHLTNPSELFDGATARISDSAQIKILTDAIEWVKTDTAHKPPEQLTPALYVSYIDHLMRQMKRVVKNEI